MEKEKTGISGSFGLIPTAPMSEAEAGENQASLFALIERLQASLERDARALLALDLTRIRQETAEQAIMSGELKSKLAQLQPPQAHSRELAQKARRVLEASRLQLALLARSQRKLRVMANMLAGPSADYGPALARSPNSPIVCSRNLARGFMGG
jgi:hypothetical protein